MRKGKIDPRILGILSTGIFPYSSLPGRLPSLEQHFLIKCTVNNVQARGLSCGEKLQVASKKLFITPKSMGEDLGDAGYLCDEALERRDSTVEDEEVVILLLKEIIEYKSKKVSSWIVESKLKSLCGHYKCLLKPHKNGFIKVLAKEFAVNHKQVCVAAKALIDNQNESELRVAKNEELLRNLLIPEYSWLFMHIGKLEGGVKFLVDLRTDVLDLMQELGKEDNSHVLELEQLSSTIKELLSMWFSVGFLDLERVTWRSPCEMLQKISEYEAVHPVRSWTDLKRRVGPYRRCFVFLHSSMPGEPLVVLHTALSDEICSSMRGIVSARSRMSVDLQGGQEMLMAPQQEDPQQIKAAVFYSITSTQKGLQGIELGNYLIKRVVRELQTEFPCVTQFSSLSPIPAFRTWLLDKLKAAEKGQTDVLTVEETTKLQAHLKRNDFLVELKRLVNCNLWADDSVLVELLHAPLMRLCVRYLYLEKRRGYALDGVANFHLRNGAVMWRVNWQADLSPRGLGNSCGIMVNYRYFLEQTENNSKQYLETHSIEASAQVRNLADSAQQLMVTSKM